MGISLHWDFQACSKLRYMPAITLAVSFILTKCNRSYFHGRVWTKLKLDNLVLAVTGFSMPWRIKITGSRNRSIFPLQTLKMCNWSPSLNIYIEREREKKSKLSIMVSSVSVNCKHICQALLQTAVQDQSLHPGFLGQLRNLGGGWRVLLFFSLQ